MFRTASVFVETASQNTARAPRWLIVATIAFTLLILAMAVAETNLWMHFLVDRGEYISVAGVIFITIVGFYLYRRESLKVSLPLFIPWLLYPVLTQGDQLIDNLTINQMRLVCDVILAVIFGAPILVSVLAIHDFVRPLNRGDVVITVMTLLIAEIWVAYVFLGWYLIWTLVFMAVVFLAAAGTKPNLVRLRMTESLALKVMITGSVISLGLFFGFKNRPGAYQGSPAAFMDPSQKNSVYDMTRVTVPATNEEAINLAPAAEVREVFTTYGIVLKGMVHAYWLMDRNYNYSFHNELFWRATPVVPEFRKKGLDEIRHMQELATAADERADALRMLLPTNSRATALLDDVRGFVDYTLRRAAKLEEMSAEFQKTKAGLQHATHLYEGEGKLVGTLLSELAKKHQTTLESTELNRLTRAFVQSSREASDQYANRIVGF